jgi:hypothetical protein
MTESATFKCDRCGVPLGSIKFTNHEASWQVVCTCGASYIVGSHGMTFREGCRHPKFVVGEPAKRLNIIYGIKKRAAQHAQRYARLVDTCEDSIKELRQEVVEAKVFDQQLDAATKDPQQTAEALLRHIGEEQLAAILDGLR